MSVCDSKGYTCQSNQKETDPLDLICAIRARDIYRDDTTVPSGYRVIAFRPPTPYDTWVNDLGSLQVPGLGYILPQGPRWIVEKKPTRKRIIFEETGEERIAVQGEWADTECGPYQIGFPASGKRLKILTRREEIIEE